MVEECFCRTNGELIDRKAELSPGEEIKSIFGKWQTLVLNGVHDKDTLNHFSDNRLSVVKQEYDAYGSITSQKFFHADGSEAAGFDGFSEVSAIYNQLRLPELLIAKLPGEPPELIKLRITYTPRYNVERATFLDSKDQPVLSRLGFAEIRFEHDERDQLIKTQYVDAKGDIISEK